jgi:hypothetical protein
MVVDTFNKLFSACTQQLFEPVIIKLTVMISFSEDGACMFHLGCFSHAISYLPTRVSVGRSQYAKSIFRSAVCYTNVRLSVRHASGLCEN